MRIWRCQISRPNLRLPARSVLEHENGSPQAPDGDDHAEVEGHMLAQSQSESIFVRNSLGITFKK
ncbi:hypothetical protein I7I48_00204 [Histoplasma ohiense]|uniref:Uncharacterized protein n=1 Tax=Ajellomyces capsulatus (strain H88) TaxID=544711 RepID=A0A8A1LSH0_AJEC8|nr:hypothetical protein I7I48_00204 [Histoplasma ohiense (nom. inval.)]QSS54937.1 hypothetical protein I7I53_02660 [Histoplasma capsulatum var. duboisii H88]